VSQIKKIKSEYELIGFGFGCGTSGLVRTFFRKLFCVLFGAGWPVFDKGDIQWFYRIVVVGVLYRIRSVKFGPCISRTENPNDLGPTLAS